MSKKVLIIDIGNTATEFAVFNGKNLQDFLGFFKLPDEIEKAKIALKSFKNQGYSIDDAMIFSVVPKIEDFVKKIVEDVFEKRPDVFDWKRYELDNKSKKIKEAIGADLLADIIAARNEKNFPSLIVDFGTITKLLYLDENGSFEGLSMIPGLEASLKTFSMKTALLPDLEELKSLSSLGTDTVSSMYHGVYYSTLYYVNGVLNSLDNDKIKLIITGGNLRFIKDEFKDAIIDPELTLKGMNILYQEIRK